jgi:hypothetical protein
MIDPEKVKTDSIAILRSLGIPTIDHLPHLEADQLMNLKLAAKHSR